MDFVLFQTGVIWTDVTMQDSDGSILLPFAIREYFQNKTCCVLPAIPVKCSLSEMELELA